MKIFEKLILVILSLFLISGCAEGQTKRKKTSGKPPANTSKPMPETNRDYKVLAEGQYSKAESPFVFAARDAETYALLRSLIEGLPPSSTIDFTKTIVVAAFAGEKNTGGYSVKVHPKVDKVVVEVHAPEKGSMTAQVISSPFQAVAISIREYQSLSIEIPSEWTSRIQNFKVTKADFENSGGIVGRMNKFSVDGTIGVLKHGELITYLFNLSGKGAESSKKLTDAASGVLKEGEVLITQLDAGTFAQMPHPPLKVFGKETDKKLSLIFESLPPTVSDGFMVRGKLEAAAVK